MQINELREICDVLIKAGKGDEWCDFQHDIVYLPYRERYDETAKKLEALGCHWDSGECWAHF